MEEKMQPIRIAVCDDEEFYCKELEKMVSVYGNETETELLIDVYSDASVLVEAVKKREKTYEMMFLDIDMPGMNGIEAAKAIRETDENVLLGFVTSHTTYALDAYGVEAIAYIVKPIKYKDVKKIVEKAKIQIYYRKDAAAAEKRYLEVKSGRENVLIDLEKVVYIEKRRNQCVFHLTDGEQVCYDTLAKVYKQLDSEQFLYTHQGYIVNFYHIKEVRRDAVCLGAGMEIPVSRKYYDTLKKRHMDKIYRVRDERRSEAAYS